MQRRLSCPDWAVMSRLSISSPSARAVVAPSHHFFDFVHNAHVGGGVIIVVGVVGIGGWWEENWGGSTSVLAVF